ncbi:hypothetical protein HOLleu_35948 [Holothuria leucospilota]|uniref:C17orf113 probable zinc finger domain-containing protein n=1 Tax=Holothuria leucospilota TaxID=206669 RepID=A0A9Q0YQM0_HOLLE|nr:hypothetical protein HOLleu_35948 [Holothuria leucospilota]
MSKRRKLDPATPPVGTLDRFFRKQTPSDRENYPTDGPANVPQPGPSGRDGDTVTEDDAHHQPDAPSVEEPGADFPAQAPSTSGAKKKTKGKQANYFHPEWKKKRPWLHHEPDIGMFCLLCQKYKKMPYGRRKWNTAPCVRMREGSVKEHEESESHKDAV